MSVSKAENASVNTDDPPLRVLVIQGHPRSGSLCAALASAYADGARRAGAVVEELTLAEISFDAHVWRNSPEQQPLEPDLARALTLIEDSDHLVFAYPTWWGTMPALLKGFLDRVLLPGRAFRFHADGKSWDKLLYGRTAELITTMDTPPWVHRLFNRRPGHNAMRRATLGFCGIRTVNETVCGPVAVSRVSDRDRWLRRVHKRGLALASGPLKRHQLIGDRIAAWLQSLRLQFYPMTWAAYTMGALAAPLFDAPRYWLGYVLLFLLEAATVWTNEVQDYESDRRNQAFGPFTGGSRVVVDGKLCARRLNQAATGAILLAGGGALLLLNWVPDPLTAALVLIGLAVLALGYTLPPLRFCYRGLGELDVALTHSIAVLLCGFVFQGGSLATTAPWLLSLPLGLAVFGAILMGGVPDIDADRQAGKRTLAVRLGPARSAMVAAMAAVAAAITALWVSAAGIVAYDGVLLSMITHAALLAGLLLRYARRQPAPGRIDGLLVTALAFILWFCVPPLFRL